MLANITEVDEELLVMDGLYEPMDYQSHRYSGIIDSLYRPGTHAVDLFCSLNREGSGTVHNGDDPLYKRLLLPGNRGLNRGAVGVLDGKELFSMLTLGTRKSRKRSTGKRKLSDTLLFFTEHPHDLGWLHVPLLDEPVPSVSGKTLLWFKSPGWTYVGQFLKQPLYIKGYLYSYPKK